MIVIITFQRACLGVVGQGVSDEPRRHEDVGSLDQACDPVAKAPRERRPHAIGSAKKINDLRNADFYLNEGAPFV